MKRTKISSDWTALAVLALTSYAVVGLLWWWRDPGCALVDYLASDAKACPAPSDANLVFFLYLTAGTAVGFGPGRLVRRWLRRSSADQPAGDVDDDPRER